MDTELDLSDSRVKDDDPPKIKKKPDWFKTTSAEQWVWVAMQRRFKVMRMM